MINKFTSVSFIYDESDLKIFDEIQTLLSQMYMELKHSELIIIVKNEFLSKSIKYQLDQLEKYSIPIKIVITNKPTKDYVYNNLSWKCAMGDYIIFNRDISKLLNIKFSEITEQLNANPLVWFVDKEYKSTYLRELSRGYNLLYTGKFKSNYKIIDESTSGFAITRQGCNKVFENYNEIYDTFSTLATSGLTSSIIYLNKDDEYHIDSQYDLMNGLELLLIYTKNYGFLLYFMMALIVYLIIGQLLNYQMLGLIFAFFIGLHMIYTLQKYTLDASQHKQLAGQYEIIVIK